MRRRCAENWDGCGGGVRRTRRDVRGDARAVCCSPIRVSERVGLSGAEPLQYCRQFRQYCERSAEDSPTPSPSLFSCGLAEPALVSTRQHALTPDHHSQCSSQESRNGNPSAGRPRYAPRLPPFAGIPAHGHRHARPRHRRHDGDLHDAERGPSQAASVSQPAGSLQPADRPHGRPGHHRTSVGRRDLPAERSEAVHRARGGIPAGRPHAARRGRNAVARARCMR